MDNTIQSDLIRGHINTIILKALFDGDRYGYDIVKEIEQKSSGQYKLKQPTLYSCLKRLELQGFIRSYWGAKSNGGRRKYFTLTDMGRELFIKNQSEWEYSRTVIDKLISDKEVDLECLPESGGYKEPLEKSTVEFGGKPLEETTEVFLERTEESADNPSVTTPANATVTGETAESDREVAASETAAETRLTASSPVFLDTTAIMNRLYRQQVERSDDGSYADKLVAEKYVADRTAVSAEDYFKDFFNEAEEKPFDAQLERIPEPPADFAAADSYFTRPAPDPTYADRAADEKDAPKAYVTSGEKAVRTEAEIVLSSGTMETERNLSDQFRKYDEPPPESGPDNILDREYRNILGSFAEASFTVSPRAEKIGVAAADPDSSAKDESFAAVGQEESPAAVYTLDAQVNKKLEKLTGDVREMGDNLKIRTHNGETSKQYGNLFYYYSNKLMLVHYAILFGIMALETLGCSLVVYLGFGAGQSYDVWFYIAAVLFALIFPTVAFIKNYTAPNKRKRINFSLKSSLIYRFIVMGQCWLIVYCLNIFFRMPLSFSLTYLTSLLLPALLCTNFPVSALIFSSLFKSKKYAVEE